MSNPYESPRHEESPAMPVPGTPRANGGPQSPLVRQVTLVGVLMIDYGVNLLLVLVGYRTGGRAPILAKGESAAELARTGVDPLPQAMVLTSIVIGLGLTALMVALAIRLYQKYGTFDMNEIRRLRG